MFSYICVYACELMWILIYEGNIKRCMVHVCATIFILLYDLTPRLALLPPLLSLLTGDAAGTRATGFPPAGPSPRRLHLSPRLQRHHGHHPATHAHALRGGMPRGGGFFCSALWCVSHIYLFHWARKSDWFKNCGPRCDVLSRYAHENCTLFRTL